MIQRTQKNQYGVALRKESVDRNTQKKHPLTEPIESLSARRAWIEMCLLLTFWPFRHWSLSARRAWIEISSSLDDILAGVVALRKESVDRNTMRRDFKSLGLRRSPQGERG